MATPTESTKASAFAGGRGLGARSWPVLPVIRKTAASAAAAQAATSLVRLRRTADRLDDERVQPVGHVRADRLGGPARPPPLERGAVQPFEPLAVRQDARDHVLQLAPAAQADDRSALVEPRMARHGVDDRNAPVAQ